MLFRAYKEEWPLLEYYRPIYTDKGFALTIDKMTVDYRLAGSADNLSILMQFLDVLPIRFAVDIHHWTSFKIGTFKENFSIIFQNGNSFWLGVALNSVKPEWKRVRLEFNPNKCTGHTVFLEVLAFLNCHSRPMHTVIKRFDLALDIPVERFSVFLIKDSRTYIERRHGQEWTQYLGAKSSTVGRVKLYNKAVESQLSYPLTRLEITLDPATPFEAIPWPKVYYIKQHQVNVTELHLTDTERFILSALLSGFGTTKELCRKTREKMERCLNYYVQHIIISSYDYAQLLFNLRLFLLYPQKDLGVNNENSDQPPPPRPILPAWVQEADSSDEIQLTDYALVPDPNLNLNQRSQTPPF